MDKYGCEFTFRIKKGGWCNICGKGFTDSWENHRLGEEHKSLVSISKPKKKLDGVHND